MLTSTASRRFDAMMRSALLLAFLSIGCTLPDVRVQPADPGQSHAATEQRSGVADREDVGTKPLSTAAAAGSPNVAPKAPMIAPGVAGSMSGKEGAAGSGGAMPPPAPPAPDGGISAGTTNAGAGPSTLPCDVYGVLAKNCQVCHSATPVGGAPMPLMTYADLHAPARTLPVLKVYELVQQRIHDLNRPMPPTIVGTLPGADIAILDAWLRGGALSGPSSDTVCRPAVSNNPPTTTKPAEMSSGETCYELKLHGSTTNIDESPFDVAMGETYEQFYFKVPWPQGTVATHFSARLDNAQVHHHWFLFSTNETQPEGAHLTAPLPTLIGTDPQLLAAWTAGDSELVAPQDVGIELPNPGRTIDLQVHFVNHSGAAQRDASAARICTVPASARAHVAAFTALGTEDLNGNVWSGGEGMPAKQVSAFKAPCTPSRMGVSGDEPIHILGFLPHMHRLGVNLKSELRETGGQMQTLFDKPYTFGQGRFYPQEHTLAQGQQIHTTCTFNNDTNRGIPFGEAEDLEMCYLFTLAYPARALSNSAFSLLGWTNVCW